MLGPQARHFPHLRQQHVSCKVWWASPSSGEVSGRAHPLVSIRCLTDAPKAVLRPPRLAILSLCAGGAWCGAGDLEGGHQQCPSQDQSPEKICVRAAHWPPVLTAPWEPPGGDDRGPPPQAPNRQSHRASETHCLAVMLWKMLPLSEAPASLGQNRLPETQNVAFGKLLASEP